jgi:hypothetical protein
MTESMHASTEAALARRTPAESDRSADLAHCAEQLLGTTWDELIEIDEHVVSAELTERGQALLVPIGQALGLGEEAPINAIALMRWYRRCMDAAVLMAVGVPIDGMDEVHRERPEESLERVT